MFVLASALLVGLCIAALLKASLRSARDVDRTWGAVKDAARDFSQQPLQYRLHSCGPEEYAIGSFEGHVVSEQDMFVDTLRVTSSTLLRFSSIVAGIGSSRYGDGRVLLIGSGMLLSWVAAEPTVAVYDGGGIVFVIVLLAAPW